MVDALRVAIAIAFTGVVIWAGWSDIRRRKIPNAAVGTLLVLFLAWAALHTVSDLTSSLLAGLTGLAVTAALWMFGVIGAGDSKMFFAVSLFAGLAALPFLAVATAIAGGLIVLAGLVARPRRAMVLFSMRGKGDWGEGVPYGVAIAIGGAAVVWGDLLGLLGSLPTL